QSPAQEARARRPHSHPHCARSGILVLARIGKCRMRSVYAKILLWGFGLLLLCSACVAAWFFLSVRPPGKEMFLGIIAVQMEQAAEAYETGGAPRLAAFLEKMDRLMPGRHYFVDRAGKDLVTGADRSAMLPPNLSQGRWTEHRGDKLSTVNTSPDDKYRL